jgi:hypothetical protein
MSITDAKRDLLAGWMLQRRCFPELDDADVIDITYDVPMRLEHERQDLPKLQFKSRRVK